LVDLFEYVMMHGITNPKSWSSIQNPALPNVSCSQV